MTEAPQIRNPDQATFPTYTVRDIMGADYSPAQNDSNFLGTRVKRITRRIENSFWEQDVIEAHFKMLPETRIPNEWVQYAFQEGRTGSKTATQTIIRAEQKLREIIPAAITYVEVYPRISQRAAEQLVVYAPNATCNPETRRWEWEQTAAWSIPLDEKARIKKTTGQHSEEFPVHDADPVEIYGYIKNLIHVYSQGSINPRENEVAWMIREFSSFSEQLTTIFSEAASRDVILDTPEKRLAELILLTFTPVNDTAKQAIANIKETYTPLQSTFTENDGMKNSRIDWNYYVNVLNQLGEYQLTDWARYFFGISQQENVSLGLGIWFSCLEPVNVVKILNHIHLQKKQWGAHADGINSQLEMQIAGTNVADRVKYIGEGVRQASEITTRIAGLPLYIVGGIKHALTGDGGIPEMLGNGLFHTRVSVEHLVAHAKHGPLDSRQPQLSAKNSHTPLLRAENITISKE